MGELVLACDVKSDNKTHKPRAYHALCIGPNNAGTGHSVFKLVTEDMIVTPRCKPIPIPDDVIKVINQIVSLKKPFCFIIIANSNTLPRLDRIQWVTK